MKCVLFDIDGTINQTKLYAIEAYQKTLLKRGIIASEKEIISCIGLTPEMIIDKFFGIMSKEDLKSWQEDIKQAELELMKHKAKPFDGIARVLKELKARGYVLGICSNAYQEHIENVLSALELRDYFSIIGSLENGNNKKEVIENIIKKDKNMTICMIGDRKFDLEAASDNKCLFIGCLYGYAPEEIKKTRYTVTHPIEILKLISDIL